MCGNPFDVDQHWDLKKWTRSRPGKNAVYDTSSNIFRLHSFKNENVTDRYLIVDASDNSIPLNFICRNIREFLWTVISKNSRFLSHLMVSLELVARGYILKTVIHRTSNEGQNSVIIGTGPCCGDDDSATLIVFYDTAALFLSTPRSCGAIALFIKAERWNLPPMALSF